MYIQHFIKYFIIKLTKQYTLKSIIYIKNNEIKEYNQINSQ